MVPYDSCRSVERERGGLRLAKLRHSGGRRNLKRAVTLELRRPPTTGLAERSGDSCGFVQHEPNAGYQFGQGERLVEEMRHSATRGQMGLTLATVP